MGISGLSALGAALGGIGGFAGGTASALEEQRKEALAQQKLDEERQYRDAQVTLERDRLKQTGPIDFSALPAPLRAIVDPQGMGGQLDPRMLPAIVEQGKVAQQRSLGGQAANALEAQFPPNDVQGPTRSGEPIGLQPTMPANISALLPFLRSGLVEKPAEMLSQAFPKPELKEVTNPDGSTDYVPFNPMTGAPVPGGQRTTKSPNDFAALTAFLTRGAPATSPGGPVDAAAAGPAATPGAAGPSTLPGYELPSISAKVGNATVNLKPRDVSNAYSAAAFFGSGGRTTDLQTLTPEERVVAQRLYQQGETRNPDLLVASYLQSGDPAQADLAKRYLQIQKDRESGNAAAVETARIRATPVSDTLTSAITAHTNTLGAIRQLKTFSPDEIASFIGWVNKPYQEAIQGLAGMGIANANDRFAEFQTAMGRLRSTAFESGGKQLTPTEERVVYAYTPTGDERNVTQVVQKVKFLEGYTAAKRDLLVELSKTGRENIDPAQYDAMLQQRLQAAGVPIPKEAPGWSQATATPKIGEPGYTGRVVQPDMPHTPAGPGKVWIQAPDGVWGKWDARQPVPQGYRR